MFACATVFFYFPSCSGVHRLHGARPAAASEYRVVMGSDAGVVGVRGILPVPFGVISCRRCWLRVIGPFLGRRAGVTPVGAAIIAIVVALVLSRSYNEDSAMPYVRVRVLRLSLMNLFGILCHASLWAVSSAFISSNTSTIASCHYCVVLSI